MKNNGCLLGCVLLLSGCCSVSAGAAERFSTDYTCPRKRIVTTRRPDVPAHDVLKSWAAQPPTDLGTDPDRLAMWQSRVDKMKREVDRRTVIDVSGCERTARYACRVDSDDPQVSTHVSCLASGEGLVEGFGGELAGLTNGLAEGLPPGSSSPASTEISIAETTFKTDQLEIVTRDNAGQILVVRASGAAQELQAGDVILTMNGAAMATSSALVKALTNSTVSSDPISLTILRAGATRTIAIAPSLSPL